MSQAYLGEIRLFAGYIPPSGWAFCEGQLLPRPAYDALFQLIGTFYGGDGINAFALPDFRGRVPVHQGTGPGLSSRFIAQNGGTESVTLTTAQIPVHNHQARGSSSPGTQTSPANQFWAAGQPPAYSSGTPAAVMDPAAVGPAGSSLPHENMVPFLAVNFIIAFDGVFPSQ